MINVNDFKGITDSDTIESALNHLQPDGILLIPPRISDIEPERRHWLLDRAVLLPANTTVILQNCTVQLSDLCRDNFFRSANCGLGIEDPEKIENIHIRGEGLCILRGADHPRAVGDSSKILANPCPYEVQDLCRLADWIPEERRTPGTINFWDRHTHSFGTDAGKAGESQYGDWRGIGILLANVDNFSISNLRIECSHGWAISLEACTNGTVEKIYFDACMSKMIDGMRQNMENQDGIDLRNGCHHILISDITGHTGDDVIALTAIAGANYKPGGSLRTTHVMHNDWNRRERDIHDVIIRNVNAYSQLCYVIRLLPANAKIWNIVIDGIIDAPPSGLRHSCCIELGDGGDYGENPVDGMKNITISNVICDANEAIRVSSYLNDSVITNVVNRNPHCPAISVKREDGLRNVAVSNVVTCGGK
ncbi:MAG: hypothetical protein IJ493_10330 [Clostridia bacterium]|nr:hypothetical protein [Clostridia bacterium]